VRSAYVLPREPNANAKSVTFSTLHYEAFARSISESNLLRRCNLVDSAIVWNIDQRVLLSPSRDLVHHGAPSSSLCPTRGKGLELFAATQHDNITLERLQRGDTVIALIDGIIVATEQSTSLHYANRVLRSIVKTAVRIFPNLLLSRGSRARCRLRIVVAARRACCSAGCNFIACDTAEHADDLRAYYSRCGYEFIDRVHWEGKTYGSVILVKSLTRPK